MTKGKAENGAVSSMIAGLGAIFGFTPDLTKVRSERGRIIKEGFSCRCDGTDVRGCPNKQVCMEGYYAMSRCFKIGDIDDKDRALMESWHAVSCECKGMPKLQGRALAIVKLGSEIGETA